MRNVKVVFQNALMFALILDDVLFLCERHIPTLAARLFVGLCVGSMVLPCDMAIPPMLR